MMRYVGKLIDAFLIAIGVWFYISPIANLPETAFLISLVMLVWFLSTFFPWKEKGDVFTKSRLENPFVWYVRYGVVCSSGSVWYFNYSHITIGELIISTAVTIVLGMLLAICFKKTIWKNY